MFKILHETRPRGPNLSLFISQNLSQSLSQPLAQSLFQSFSLTHTQPRVMRTYEVHSTQLYASCSSFSWTIMIRDWPRVTAFLCPLYIVTDVLTPSKFCTSSTKATVLVFSHVITVSYSHVGSDRNPH